MERGQGQGRDGGGSEDSVGGVVSNLDPSKGRIPVRSRVELTVICDC